MPQSSAVEPRLEKSGISFAGFNLEADGALLRGETPVHLPPKELAALRLLLAHAGRIVTPLQLRQALWGDVHVTVDSVPKCLSSLRACLEPEDCIQTVYKRGYRLTAEVRVHGGGPGGRLPRLAILPLAAGFGVPDHLGSAIAEETMARLTNLRPAPASVLAQDSVFTLAARGLSALETGQALHADLVLAGTLRALPHHYRLRAEMIRVADGTQIWVEDLLVERDRIAGPETELIDRLCLRLGSGIPSELSLPGRADEPLSLSAAAEPEPESTLERLEAYEIFQRAHSEWQTLQRHRMQDGLQHLLRATELDPSLIGARIDLVNLCVAQGFYGFMSPIVAGEIVHRAADSVLDPAIHAEALLPALGWVRFHVDRNLPAALSDFSLSSHLPHNPWTTRARSMFALSRHRFSEAIEMLREAIHLDPFAPWLHSRLAWAYHLAGDAPASLHQIQNALAQFPDHEGANLYASVILAFNGETAKAVECARQLAERLPYFDLATAVHAYTLACAGHGDEARTILERLQWLGRERFLLKAFTPAVHIALGEPDAALAELRASNEIRCPWFFQMLADPCLQPLHGHLEFEQMNAILPTMEAEAAAS